MYIEFIKSAEKKKILEKLESQYGIKEIPFLLIRTGKDKLRAFSGSLGKVEIVELFKELNVENIGIYLLTEEENNRELRLGFDATNLLKINKNILEINKKQADDWLLGRDIEIDSSLNDFFVLKFNEDFLGCGKASNGIIRNYVPKERRRKS